MKGTIFSKYTYWVEFSKMKYPPIVWVVLSIVTAIIVGFVSLLLSIALIRDPTLLPLAFSSAIGILMLGYPYMKKESITDSIEKNFSDALKQMADTLKAGDTYESALREVASSDYGRLSEEMDLALRRLQEGENIETALNVFAERIDSRMIKRTIVILLDSIRTGSSLADILEEIADDVRDIYRLKEERKSNTMMQFLFMIVSGGMVAPLIFGEINSIMSIFSKITIESLSVGEVAASQNITNFILLLIQAYIIIEVIASGLIMSIIREGKFNKSIIYIPVLLLLAFLVYHISTIVIRGWVLGAI